MLVLGPIAFNSSRDSSFRTSIEIFPREVGPYPAVLDPAYYAQLLRDPHLRQRTTVNVGADAADFDDVSVARSASGRTLVVSAAAATPADAQRFATELGPQLANATVRQLSPVAKADTARIRARLTDERLSRAERDRLQRRLSAIERLGPD
ncbi:MAG: hypothetical protein M3340_12015, partial [Actinomycetota bacterium]|nr:hypothetical protein [Actinomycetota bacterium]